MKKLFFTLFMFLLALSLFACVKPEEPTVDTTAPLFFGISDVVVNIGDEFDPLASITAIDDIDGDITANIVVTGTYSLTEADTYTLTYTVTDAAGNTTTATRKVIVREKPLSELFVTNGDFSEGISGTWTHWAGEGGASTVEIIDGVLNYNITANGSQWWSSQFSQPNLVIPQGKNFIFEFDAKASVARPLVVKLENAQNIGYFDEGFMLTTEWVTYTIEFYVTAPTITNGKLIFGGGTGLGYVGVAGELGTIYLDNIKFIETEADDDTTPPEIIGATDKTIGLNENFNPLAGVTVFDNRDVNLTVDDIVITGEVDSTTPGPYTLTYTLTDASNNQTIVTRVITVVEGLVESTWLVVNGDFSTEQLAPLPQPAEAGWGWHGAGTFTAKIQDGVAQINITNLGTVSHGVQFYQQNRIIEQGRKYRVTFDARADIARPIQVALEQGVTRRFDQIVDLTTEWTTYVVEIDHILPGYVNGKFAFFMGLVGTTSVPTTVYLDNVTVETIASIVDDQKPELQGVDDYVIMKGIEFDPLLGVTLFDAVDKDITIEDIIITGTVDTSIVGEHLLVYTITDASDNTAIYERTIHVKEAADMLESTFKLVNGDFTDEQLTPRAQPAVDGWGWHGGGAFTVEIKDGIATQVITSVGTVAHGTQFYQQNRIIETQAMYRITFDAKVDLARSIRLSLEAGTAVQFFKIIDITTDWATYEVIMKIPGAGFTNGKFAFFAGLVETDSPATTFYLDNINIELVGYLVDTAGPIIIGANAIEIEAGIEFDPLLGVTVFDIIDKSLTVDNIIVTGNVDIYEPGVYTITYVITDRQGNTTTLNREVTVIETDGLPSTFKIINGDFETDQSVPAASGLGWGWHGNGQFNINIIDGVAVIDIYDNWTLFFGVQFYILNRELREGHIYSISFKAKADVARPILMQLESSGAKFSSYFDLTNEWTTFTYEYAHTGPSFTNGKFAFFLGEIHGLSTPTTVYIDDVTVERIETLSIDTTAPQIWNIEDYFVIKNTSFNPMAGVRVYDHVDKTLLPADVIVTGTVDLTLPGDYTLTYELTDASGNKATYTRVVTVIEEVEATESRIVLVDPDFEAQTPITNQDNNMGWTLKGNGGYSHVFNNGTIEINITNVGTIPHSIQFFQRNGFSAEAGSTYLLTFKAKADAARDIRVSFERIANNGFAVIDFNIVSLTTEWVTYEVVLQNTLENSNDVKIGFFLGLIDSEAPENSALTTVYFDDVTLKLIGYNKDTNAPRFYSTDATIETNATFNPLSGIKYGDSSKNPSIVVTSDTVGFITYNSETKTYTVNTSNAGTYTLTYTLVDFHGNEAVYTRIISIEDPIVE